MAKHKKLDMTNVFWCYPKSRGLVKITLIGVRLVKFIGEVLQEIGGRWCPVFFQIRNSIGTKVVNLINHHEYTKELMKHLLST